MSNKLIKNKAKSSKKYFSGTKFSILLTQKDLVNFMLFHTYANITSWFGVLISIASLVYFGIQYETLSVTGKMLFLFIGLIFTVINPLALREKAIKQARKNPATKRPTTYVLADRVLSIEQGSEQLTVPWDEVVRIKDSGRSLIVYLDKRKAFIWPKSQIAGHYDQIKMILMQKMDKKRVRIR